MHGQEISSLMAAANAAANAAINDRGRSVQREAELNSARIEVVAEKLALCAHSSGQKDEARLFFQLCLSLARELDMMVEDSLGVNKHLHRDNWPHVQRGIDYGVANNEIPERASKLPPILKQVCRRKNEFFLQAAIMVLMISVKNACKMGWFTSKDTEELLTLANEVGSYFSTMGELNCEVSIPPTVSSIMSRFYPLFKMGHVIASLEVKPGYGTYLLDFHISKNVPYSADEKIRLFVAMKDNIDTSSCIVSPQKVNLLLNGRAVERRTNVYMDPGPQFPTAVNHLLKYGTNLLQAVGHFSGHYIILIAFMSIVPPSSLSIPEDYVQADTAALSSDPDPEIIEGPSRISLNCPITYRRIRMPVKGHFCKHYQCFDLGNYVELNSKRPSWRCPHCNQSVCFTDLRVDQRMAKVLQEVDENVSEVIISADGSWTAASSGNHKSHDKASADQEEQHEHLDSSGTDASCKVYDLTEEDDWMEIVDKSEPEDTKPLVHPNVRNQQVPIDLTPSPAPISIENPHLSALVSNSLLSETLLGNSGPASYNIRSEVQTRSDISGFPTGNSGISPVLTDSVSPSLNRQSDNFQGTNYPTTSIAHCQFSASNSLHLRDVLYPQSGTSNEFGGVRIIPRNVTRTQSAIQALPVQTSSPHQLQLRPNLSTHGTVTPSPHQLQLRPNPSTHGTVAPSPHQLQLRPNPSTHGTVTPSPHQLQLRPNPGTHGTVRSSISGSNIDRQRHIQQSHVNPASLSNMSPTTLQNRAAPRVVGLSAPNQGVNTRMPQTLSQPPHLRSSQVPHNHVQQQGVSHGGVSNSPSTVERIQLMAQHHSPQMRQHQQPTPLQTQAVRMASPPVTPGPTPPQAVSRTENLIDLQSEQNWRPTGRMRGSLTGQAYSAALSQFFGQAAQPAQAPGPRPSGSTASLPPSPQLQALANRMHSQVSQVLNRPATNASTGAGAAGTLPEGPQGFN